VKDWQDEIEKKITSLQTNRQIMLKYVQENIQIFKDQLNLLENKMTTLQNNIQVKTTHCIEDSALKTAIGEGVARFSEKKFSMKTLCVATDFDVRLCEIRHLAQPEADTDAINKLYVEQWVKTLTN